MIPPAKTPKRPKDEEEEEKDEKEDEDDKESKEDKDEDFSKPFVAMNFKNFNLNDQGILIKHQIDRSNSDHKRFHSYKPFLNSGGGRGEYKPFSSDNGHRTHTAYGGSDDGEREEYHNTFPNVPPKEDSADNPQFEDPEVVKAFVTSMFNKGGDAGRSASSSSSFKDFLSPKPSNVEKHSSPFNPHFGERVKMISKPAQNLLWHRKANERESSFRDREKLWHRSKAYEPREERSGHLLRGREKSLLNQESSKIFDSLPKDFSFKQSSKRDVDFDGNASEPSTDFSANVNVTTENPYVGTENIGTEESAESYTTSLPASVEETRSYEQHSAELPNNESEDGTASF